jgi:hypothetical protein
VSFALAIVVVIPRWYTIILDDVYPGR